MPHFYEGASQSILSVLSRRMAACVTEEVALLPNMNPCTGRSGLAELEEEEEEQEGRDPGC